MDFDPTEMDSAAMDAEEALAELPVDAVKAVAQWWFDWYMKAGHKRLGRVLVRFHKQSESEKGG